MLDNISQSHHQQIEVIRLVYIHFTLLDFASFQNFFILCIISNFW